MKLLNAFSLNMLAPFDAGALTIEIRNLDVADVKRMLHCHSGESCVDSYVGHADTAALFSNILGISVPCLRKTIKFRGSEEFIVGQYIGDRLPEGTTTLPEGATISWFYVQVF